MSQTQVDPSIDMIRWTFTANPDRGDEMVAYLNDLGADLVSRSDAQFWVLWDEPGSDLDEVVERLWAINGAPFEVTHETFHRLDLLVYQAEDGETESEAA
ncbi:hypothetical protein AB1L88_16980 [Tautonia sp. JC769]|uniref:hypothetical protein n=1 Tax=Tautonia sp. JC769 TaxID=3232135 RepID=UPI003459C17F